MIDEIKSVGDCDRIIACLEKDITQKKRNRKAAFLYDGTDNRKIGWLLSIWFRGETKSDGTQLEPSIFRPFAKQENGNRCYYEENSIYNYSRNRVPLFSNTSLDQFSLLAKMQHYGTPTRLLDWSESMLIGLFFAVRNIGDKRDSLLYMLNVRKLNKITGMRQTWDNIHDDSSYGVKFRVEFVTQDTQEAWYRSLQKYKDFRWEEIEKYKGMNSYKDTQIPINALSDHCTPVAVLPSFTSIRQQFQRTVFTLHGGKIYDGTHRSVIDDENRIPKPASLISLNDCQSTEKKFLLTLNIHKKNKEKILKQLHVYGISENTLFPDSDILGSYIREVFK